MNRKPQTSALESVKETLENAEQKVERALTVSWHEVPAWQQDNQYITSGYRPASGSYKISAASLSYLHNETVNIYTHLLGAVAAVLFGVYFSGLLHPRYEYATKADIAAFSCFFGGAAACLGMSATYHTISNHSPEVNRVGNQLDYVGIVCLIWGSFVPSIFYGFSAEPGLRWAYWTMITAIGMGCATVSVDSRFRTPHWRPFRAGMFVAMGLSAVVPVIHGLRVSGLQHSLDVGLFWTVLQGVLYILGAGIYAARIPERWKPGQFDIIGSSHQIFHVLVLMAATVHLIGLLKAFDYEHGRRGYDVPPLQI